MPPLGLSKGVRKAREIGRRSLSLALARPRMVRPLARYRTRPIDGVLVLQRGENASTDYYLRPRLGTSIPVCIADIDTDPAACALLAKGGAQALMVIVCRYAAPAWLEALEAIPGRLARVAFFMDDDLPGMMRDETLPAAARGKVALHFGEHVDRLGRLAGEVWVSSPALAARYPEAAASVLTAVPEADPPEPEPSPPRRVVYHGTDVHGPERRFVLEVARGLLAADPAIEVEITADPALRRACAHLANVIPVPQRAWPDYLQAQQGRAAAISLAPLHPSAVNAARAPVKAFDAARLGAAALYADADPYRGFVRDGVDGLLMPMEPDAWTRAILDLLGEPERRLALAAAARDRLVALRRAPHAFPPAP